MKMICSCIIITLWLGGCDARPKEAVEVPEDLMREIAVEAARQTMRTEGIEILSQIKEEIAERARQEARDVAALVARDTTNSTTIEECRNMIMQSQQKTEALIAELQKQFANPSINGPSEGSASRTKSEMDSK